MTGVLGGWAEIRHRGVGYRLRDLQGRSYPLRLLTPSTSGDSIHEGGAIVMVHGMEEPWDVWADVIGSLRMRRSIFLLDLPWSGTKGYDWTLARAGCVDWLRRGLMAVPGGVSVLVAHSFGAMVVLDYLDSFGTDDLEAAALLSPLHLHRERPLDWPLVNRYSSEFVPFLECALRLRYSRGRLDPEGLTRAASIVRDKIGPIGCLEFVYLLSKSPRLRLGDIRIPVLVIGGELDPFATVDICSALAGAMPTADVEILRGCGHFCMLEQPRETAALLEEFIRRASRNVESIPQEWP